MPPSACITYICTQMYKVYRDPEGKNVQLGITTTDQPQQQQQQPRMSFQCSEEVYKSQIQKLNGEVAMLRKRVNYHCCVYVLLGILHILLSVKHWKVICAV